MYLILEEHYNFVKKCSQTANNDLPRHWVEMFDNLALLLSNHNKFNSCPPNSSSQFFLSVSTVQSTHVAHLKFNSKTKVKIYKGNVISYYSMTDLNLQSVTTKKGSIL